MKAANPTLGYRSQYGTDRGEWTTDRFVETIFKELAREEGRVPREGELMRASPTVFAIVSLAAGVLSRRSGAAAPPPDRARTVAPIDLTGNWVSIVTHGLALADGHAAKGDYRGHPDERRVERSRTPGIRRRMKRLANSASRTARPRS